MLRRIAFFLGLLTCLPSAAEAVPLVVTYTGRMFDADDNPVDGRQDVQVGLFHSEAPDDFSEPWEPAWQDTLGAVLIDGYFSLVLGSGEPLDAEDLNAEEVWISFKLESDEDWARPGSLITSAPFAVRAGVADRAEEADVALRAEGEIVATTITTPDGTPLIDPDGTWTGPIDSDYTASVRNLTIDGQPLLGTGRDWEGPALDLPNGSSVDGDTILTGSTLASLIEGQITTAVGPKADDNPIHHDRYTAQDLLDYLAAGTWAAGSDEEKLFHAPVDATVVTGDLSSDFVLKTGADTKTGELVIDGSMVARGVQADPTQGIVEDPADVQFSHDATSAALWSIETDDEDLRLMEPDDASGSSTEHLRIDDDGDIHLSPDGFETWTLEPGQSALAAISAAGATTTALELEADEARLFPGIGANDPDGLMVSDTRVLATLGSSEVEALDLQEDAVSIRAEGAHGTAAIELLGSRPTPGTTEIVLDAGQVTATADLEVTGALSVTLFSLSGALDLPGVLQVDSDSNGVDEFFVDASALTVTVPATFTDDVLAASIDTPSASTLSWGPTNATKVQFDVPIGGVGTALSASSLSVNGNLLATGPVTATLGGANIAGGLAVDADTDGNLELDGGSALAVAVPATFSAGILASTLEDRAGGTITVGGGILTDTVAFAAEVEGPSGADLEVSQGLRVTSGLALGGQLTDDSPNGALQVSTGGLLVAGGGLTVSGGGLDVTGDSLLDDAAYVQGTLSGGTSTAPAALTVGANGLQSSGEVEVTSGGLSVSAWAGGTTEIRGGVTMDGSMTLTGAGDDLTIKGMLTADSTETVTPGTAGDGTISARQFIRSGNCPIGYEKIRRATGFSGGSITYTEYDSACISSNDRGGAGGSGWVNAWQDCLDEGATLCSETQLALADSSNQLPDLDPSTDAAENRFWADCQFQDGSSDADKMCTYDTDKNGDASDDISSDSLSGSPQHNYFCCIFP